MRRNFDIWKWFELENNPELYSIIQDMIDIKLKEMLPIYIQQYMRDYGNQISVNVETKLNGKSIDLSGLESDIQRIIINGK